MATSTEPATPPDGERFPDRGTNLLDRLIRASLHHRLLVLLLAGALLAIGIVQTLRAPMDVLPDISAPTVTVITEAPGFAPEEVELLVTFPLETVLNGVPGLRRLRSVSASGISVIWVEFNWGEGTYLTRQVVSERLRQVNLPEGAEPPQLGPISSILGEITFLALTAEPDANVSELELRRVAETLLRRNLLAVSGIAQVVPIGGAEPQIRVEADPTALLQHGVTISELTDAVSAASKYPAAGFWVEGEQEYLVRGLGRARGADELAAAVVRTDNGVPLTVGDLAKVTDDEEPRRGAGSYRTRPAVILSVQKQPGANTLHLTQEVDRTLEELEPLLPEGMVIETENFRQADFIEVAVHNVSAALRDGAILVILVLFLFLGNLRTTLISALAIPLSLLAGILVISAFGGTLNTMTLGGLTIAIGALVDDAIIDVENVFRRLRQEHRRPPEERRSGLEVVFRASSEVRSAIFFATAILALVFLPLFFLPGIEGRLLQPLGLAYLTALGVSFLVSLSVTPVLCSMLLTRSNLLDRKEPWLQRVLGRSYRWTLERVLARPWPLLIASVVLLIAALAVGTTLGRSFLPPFNEGSLTVGVTSAPGVSLPVSDALGRNVEEALLEFPEVVSTSRRTGRAEKDEHVQGVNRSEIEVVLREGRSQEELVAAMREAVSDIPGINVSFGQPISHRIDHAISGSRTSLAIKIFGPDLTVLRTLARRVHDVLQHVPGIVDLSNEEQASVPQLLIDFDRRALARYGLSAVDLSQTVEALFQGTVAGEVVRDELVERVVVALPPRLHTQREMLEALPVMVTGSNGRARRLRLDDVADVRFDLGPGLVRRENVQRVALLSANVEGADLAGTVEAASRAVAEQVVVPTGYRIVYGGQFEEAVESVRWLTALSGVVLIGLYGVLFLAFRDHRHTAIVLANLPLSLIGGVFALALWGGVLSIAALVGFITLFGIATRNGVLLVNHYQGLLARGVGIDEAVMRGSLERLAPILMTALTAGLALIPLVVAGGEPGNEIQSPMAQVILGGLLTSTLLNLIVVPVLFRRWGVRAAKG